MHVMSHLGVLPERKSLLKSESERTKRLSASKTEPMQINQKAKSKLKQFIRPSTHRWRRRGVTQRIYQRFCRRLRVFLASTGHFGLPVQELEHLLPSA